MMIAWAIEHVSKGIYIETVRRTRREATQAFKEQFGVSDKEWSYYVCRSHTAVKVKVEMLE